MSEFPDEIWTKILETGAASAQLTHRDLCCLALASRRLNRISNDPALWSLLLTLHFQTLTPSPSSPKSLYKTRFERDKARRLVEWRRVVLSAESQAAVLSKNVEELEGMMVKERERMKETVDELNHLERVSPSRRASVALNVWQPEVVRGRQKQIVEQCTVPLESRLHALRMEVRLCKQQIEIHSKAYNNQKRKLSECKEALNSLKYQPLQSNQPSDSVNDCDVKRKKKRRSDRYGTS